MNMREIYRIIPNTKLEVSNLGNVRDIETNELVKLSQSYGYKRIHRNGYHLVHRLVAKAFPEICGEWFDGCEVDHIDTDRSNNNATNLRVCTHKENMNNPTTIENSGVKIEQYDLDGNYIQSFVTLSQCAKVMGISIHQLSHTYLKTNNNMVNGFILKRSDQKQTSKSYQKQTSDTLSPLMFFDTII